MCDNLEDKEKEHLKKKDNKRKKSVITYMTVEETK